jgi:hypothetical protein
MGALYDVVAPADLAVACLYVHELAKRASTIAAPSSIVAVAVPGPGFVKGT